MSCCPSVQCRNKGSGYEKPTTQTKELESRMNELLKARTEQENTIWSIKPTIPKNAEVSSLTLFETMHKK